MLSTVDAEVLACIKKHFASYDGQTFCDHAVFSRLNRDRRENKQNELSYAVFENGFFSLVKRGYLMLYYGELFYLKQQQ